MEHRRLIARTRDKPGLTARISTLIENMCPFWILRDFNGHIPSEILTAIWNQFPSLAQLSKMAVQPTYHYHYHSSNITFTFTKQYQCHLQHLAHPPTMTPSLVLTLFHHLIRRHSRSRSQGGCPTTTTLLLQPEFEKHNSMPHLQKDVDRP